MPVLETLAAGKAKPSLQTGKQAVNIPYSAAALNHLIGGALALASWAVWAYWSRPQHAGRGAVLVLIPLAWIATKVWLNRRCTPNDSATATNAGRRRWKLGLAILVSLVCMACWYAWSSIWLSAVPQLSTARACGRCWSICHSSCINPFFPPRFSSSSPAFLLSYGSLATAGLSWFWESPQPWQRGMASWVPFPQVLRGISSCRSVRCF